MSNAERNSCRLRANRILSSQHPFSHSILVRNLFMNPSDFHVSPESASRRQFINRLGAGAVALSLGPVSSLTRAESAASSGLIMKTISRTGEVLPAIGMGSFMTFDVLPGQPRDDLREVVRRFYEGGGRVVD